MILNIIIQITTIGQNAGPTFNIYSDADGYNSIFAIATTNQLIAGFRVTAPPNTTMVKIVSTGTCGTIIYTSIIGVPAVTPSVTPSPTVTPSVTPSLTPTPSTSKFPVFPPVTTTRDACNYGGYHIIYCTSMNPSSPNYDPRSCQPINTNKTNCNCLGLYDCIVSAGDDPNDPGTLNNDNNPYGANGGTGFTPGGGLGFTGN